jgi:hypothetical protein
MNRLETRISSELCSAPTRIVLTVEGPDDTMENITVNEWIERYDRVRAAMIAPVDDDGRCAVKIKLLHANEWVTLTKVDDGVTFDLNPMINMCVRQAISYVWEHTS